MKCYADFTSKVFSYNPDIKVSCIGTSYTDITYDNIKDTLSEDIGIKTFKAFNSNPYTIEGIYSDAKKQIIFIDKDDISKGLKDVKKDKKKSLK